MIAAEMTLMLRILSFRNHSNPCGRSHDSGACGGALWPKFNAEKRSAMFSERQTRKILDLRRILP